MTNTPLSQAAEALEQAYLDVANGVVKPNKMPLEPLVRAVQAMRTQEPNWINTRDEVPVGSQDVLVRGIYHGALKHDIAGLFNGVWKSQVTEDEVRFVVLDWMVIPL